MKWYNNIFCIIETEEAHKYALECAVALADNNHTCLTASRKIDCVSAAINTPIVLEG